MAFRAGQRGFRSLRVVRNLSIFMQNGFPLFRGVGASLLFGRCPDGGSCGNANAFGRYRLRGL